jgi:hypothetical protein
VPLSYTLYNQCIVSLQSLRSSPLQLRLSVDFRDGVAFFEPVHQVVELFDEGIPVQHIPDAKAVTDGLARVAWTNSTLGGADGFAWGGFVNICIGICSEVCRYFPFPHFLTSQKYLTFLDFVSKNTFPLLPSFSASSSPSTAWWISKRRLALVDRKTRVIASLSNSSSCFNSLKRVGKCTTTPLPIKFLQPWGEIGVSID